MSELPYHLRKLYAVRPGLKLYEGVSVADGTPALIHHLHPQAAADAREGRFTRFDEVTRRLATIRHPSIPRVLYRTTREEEPLYLVTEMPRGTGLDALLRRTGPLPFGTAVALLRPVVEGLAAAHRGGLVHAGLRPDRVLVSALGPARVCDLGVTELLLSEVAGELPIGDPLWTSLFPRPETVAPELLGRLRRDARVDVFGLGVLLFHLATGAWPYAPGTSLLVYNQVRAGIRPEALRTALGHTSEGFVALVTRATARDPAERPPDASALAEALDALATADSEARLVPLRRAVHDEAYTARYSEILTVVDGGLSRAEPGPAPPQPCPPPPTEEELAARAADRERQLRLAELTLEGLRTPRRGQNRARILAWVTLGILIVFLTVVLPRLLRTGTPVRTYEGGVDPRTGLTHAPPRHHDKRAAPPPVRAQRRAADDPSRRERRPPVR